MAVIRQRTQVFNQPVGVVRASSGGSEVGQAISRFANQITDTTFQIAAEDAQTRGVDAAKAVENKGLRTFNPETGKPEAFKAPAGFGRIAAQSYQSVVDRRFEASMENELRLKAQEIAQKYPYDANGYEKVMSEYLGSMSENAQGKYKTFIVENGSSFLASTKLNIQSRAAERARRQLAQSIAANLEKSTDSAYELARAGGFVPAEGAESSDVDTVVSREVSNVFNGESSGLVNIGSGSKARTAMNTATARGGVEYIHGLTGSAADRNAVDLAIRTRGREMASVPVELRPQVEALIRYVEPKNIETVLSHSANVSGDYDAVERDNLLKMQAQAEAEARRQAITYNDTLNDRVSMSNQLAVIGFTSDSPQTINASVRTIDSLLSNVNKSIEQRFLSGNLTESQYNASSMEARQGMLRPLLIQAAAEGNVEELRVAAISRNPADMANLSPKQREFVYAMHSSELFDPMEDSGFVREVLSANINSIRDSRDKQIAQFNLAQDVTALGEEAALGGISDDQFETMRIRIANEVGASLTAEQGQGELDRLNKQRAYGIINLNTSGMDSRSLNQLSTFVKTQGERSEGMTPEAIALGQSILAKTTPDNTSDVTGRIDNIRVGVAREEEIRKTAVTKQENVTRLMQGGGNTNMPDDRRLAQEILDIKGINLNDPSSETPQVISFLRDVQPEGMINDFNRIVSGLPVNGADVLLNHFARISSDPTTSGVSINRFGSALTSDAVEFLTDVNDIRNSIGGNVNDIATALIERRNDPKSDLALSNALGGISPEAYIMEYTDGYFTSPDPLVAKELSAAVEYLARTGKSSEQINARLGTIIDQRYAPAKYIADPRMPLGTITRSRYSLEAVIPNEEDRGAFISAVETQLPTGYSLFPEPDTFLGVYSQEWADSQSKNKRVMLVPDQTSAGVSYSAYFVNDVNELEPLIYEQDGQAFQPMFDTDEIADFRAERVARENEQTTEETLDAERRLNSYRSMRQANPQMGFGLMQIP